MKTKKLKYCYKDKWDGRYHSEELSIPLDMKFHKISDCKYSMLYPYDEKLYEYLENQSQVKLMVYNLQDKYILGILGDMVRLHFDSGLDLCEDWDTFDTPLYIRSYRENDKIQNGKLGKILHDKSLTTNEMMERVRALPKSELEYQDEVYDICILGLHNEKFKIIEAQYGELFIGGDSYSKFVSKTYRNINKVMDGFSYSCKKIQNQWITKDQFNDKLQQTINEILNYENN